MTGDHSGKSNPNKPIDGIRATSDADRSQEFRDGRTSIMREAQKLFETLRKQAENMDRTTSFGMMIIGQAGITREIIKDPFDGPVNMMVERRSNKAPVMFNHDKENGTYSLTIDNPVEETFTEVNFNESEYNYIAGEQGNWDDRQELVPSLNEVASVKVTKNDGSQEGFAVRANGSVVVQARDAGRNGMNRLANANEAQLNDFAQQLAGLEETIFTN